MTTACSYETTVDSYHTIRRHTPQDTNLHTYRREILKAHYEEKYLFSHSNINSDIILHIAAYTLRPSNAPIQSACWNMYAQVYHSTKTFDWRDGKPQNAPRSLFQSPRLEPANLTMRTVNIRYRDQAAGTRADRNMDVSARSVSMAAGTSGYWRVVVYYQICISGHRPGLHLYRSWLRPKS